MQPAILFAWAVFIYASLVISSFSADMITGIIFGLNVQDKRELVVALNESIWGAALPAIFVIALLTSMKSVSIRIAVLVCVAIQLTFRVYNSYFVARSLNLSQFLWGSQTYDNGQITTAGLTLNILEILFSAVVTWYAAKIRLSCISFLRN